MDFVQLNLGGGKERKERFYNLDLRKEPDVDVIADLSRNMPVRSSCCSLIYSAHFLEHLEWDDGRRFLEECYRCLKPGGCLRLLLPDFEKILSAYVNRDVDFFSVVESYLNEYDFPYYEAVYNHPEKVLEQRSAKDLPPPWHTSDEKKNRRKVKLRLRKYKFLIEFIDWFVHQYGEHKTLYDEESIIDLLQGIGYVSVERSSFKKDLDIDEQLRRGTEMYFEAQK